MVTIYDIAKRCKVSPSTVSKVINNYASIPASTKKRVEQAIKEMDYIPNTSAKSLSKGKSYNVGVLAYFGTSISPFMHPLFANLLDSFQREMNSRNYDLLFISRNVAGQNQTFYRNCVARNVDGVVLFGDTSNVEMQEVINSRLPKVGFDYFNDNMSGVFSDNYEGMFELTEHLIYFGHKNIVFVCGEDSPITSIRINAFKDALSKHNIPFYEGMIVHTRYTDTKSIQKVTHGMMSRQFRPTAIMYPDDVSAIDSLNYLKTLGVECPKDISITGFDGIDLSQKVTPALTTYRQDTAAIGKTLGEILLKHIKNADFVNEHVEIKGSLLIGGTTAKPIPWKE